MGIFYSKLSIMKSHWSRMRVDPKSFQQYICLNVFALSPDAGELLLFLLFVALSQGKAALRGHETPLKNEDQHSQYHFGIAFNPFLQTGEAAVPMGDQTTWIDW